MPLIPELSLQCQLPFICLHPIPSCSYLSSSPQKKSLVSPSRASQPGFLVTFAVPRVGYHYAIYWAHQSSEYLSEASGLSTPGPKQTLPFAPACHTQMIISCRLCLMTLKKVENALKQWPFSWVRWDKI